MTLATSESRRRRALGDLSFASRGQCTISRAWLVATLAAGLTGCAKPAPSATAAASTTQPDAGETSDPLIGSAAPDFSGPAADGGVFHLAAARGKPVVVYFYPKDETPGCTKEACSFRDAWNDLAKTGAVLVGISADSLQSHAAFAKHWQLPFVLLSDPDGAIGRLYGVPFGGVLARQTFVVGPDGIVARVYRHVDIASQTSLILADLNHSL